jgi:hypothetical protein
VGLKERKKEAKKRKIRKPDGKVENEPSLSQPGTSC